MLWAKRSRRGLLREGLQARMLLSQIAAIQQIGVGPEGPSTKSAGVPAKPASALPQPHRNRSACRRFDRRRLHPARSSSRIGP
ncbi:DUF6053 domain-containing protein [Lysobacter enzymogenes]|uniref:DUF6053 domain-containing protein n=1 Tax=Lysobacter enzymogenes TaxID=69 RepID=UPI003D18D37D